MRDRRPENQKPKGSTLWVLGESIESADGSTRYAVKYEASPADLLAAVRSAVEEGTIKGKMVEARKMSFQYDSPDWWLDEVRVDSEGTYLVIPIPDGYKPLNRKGLRHEQHCLHDEPGVTVCTCIPVSDGGSET